MTVMPSIFTRSQASQCCIQHPELRRVMPFSWMSRLCTKRSRCGRVMPSSFHDNFGNTRPRPSIVPYPSIVTFSTESA